MKLHKALNRMREMHEAYDHARREDNKRLTAWRDEVIELREQNRVLREALNTIACGTEDKIPPYRCIDFAMAKRIAQAALTATSQEGQG